MGIALGTLVVAWVLHASGVLRESGQVLTHGLYEERALSDEIVIVAIDEKTMSLPEDGGMGKLSSWPWSFYGEVLDTIEQGEPSGIFYDLLFGTESSGIHGDDLKEAFEASESEMDFALAVAEYVASPHPYDVAFAESLQKYQNVYLLKTSAGDFSWNGEAFEVESEIRPSQLFDAAAKSAFSNTVDTEDSENSNIIYAIPTQFSVDGETEEHIDLQLIREHLGTAGDLEIPTENGQMLINYAAGSYSYPMVSFTDVYHGQVDPSVFEGKIVLIGATAAIIQDRQFTPIDSEMPMPGIEIHANAIQTILDEAYLEYQSLGGFLVMVGLIVLGTVAVVLYAPILAGSAVVAAEIAAFLSMRNGVSIAG